MFFIYILKNEKGNTYTGQTNNLTKRLVRHNSGQCCSTKNKGLWKIIHSEKFTTRALAMKRERSLKSGKGREWIKLNILKQN